MMDIGKQLASFLQLASKNRHFHQSHVSLYSAILVCCEKSHCQNPFRVSRRELMKHSAIHSFATYHKCMNDLVMYGYIDYQPSYHPKLASSVTLLNESEVIHDVKTS